MEVMFLTKTVKTQVKLIHTLMPSSSLTLRIILTHISVILLKVGCSRQMSLRILITRFLTLIPVSCAPKQRIHRGFEFYVLVCIHETNADMDTMAYFCQQVAVKDCDDG